MRLRIVAAAVAALVFLVAQVALTIRWSTSPHHQVVEQRHRFLHIVRMPDVSHLRWVLDAGDAGQWWVLSAIAAVAALILIGKHRGRDVALLVPSITLVLVAVLVGKLMLPTLRTTHQFGLALGGYPSGHTASASIVIGDLALLFPARRHRLLAVVLGAAAGAAMGWQRVVVGAHTRDEVVAAWLLAVGVLCATAAVDLARDVRRRRVPAPGVPVDLQVHTQ